MMKWGLLNLDEAGAYRRKIARQNGWILLMGLPPVGLVGGMMWYLENPSVWRLIVGIFIVPIVAALPGWLAIRWGRQTGQDSNGQLEAKNRKSDAVD